MTPSDKSKQIQDLIISKSMNMVDGDLSNSQDLVGSLAQALKTSNIISDIATVNPEAADALHENLRDLEQMEALIAQAQAAEAVGNFSAMQNFADGVAALGGVDFAPDILPSPFDALRDAIDDGDLAAIRDALAGKPDLNQHIGKFGSFPLIWAMMADARSVEVLDLLVQSGADVRFATSEGYTALHWLGDYSCRHGVTADDDHAIAAYLVAQGAELGARNHYGWSPLDRAIFEGVPEEVEGLLRAGADPNARLPQRDAHCFEGGDTPLANAIADPEKVALLLAHGAEPGAVAKEEKTPLDLIDDALLAETPDGYAPYYDGLRQSRALIKAAIRKN